MSRIPPPTSHLPATPAPTSPGIEDRVKRIRTQLTTLRHIHQANIAGYETVIESLNHRVDQLVKDETTLSERVLELEIAEEEIASRMCLMAARIKEAERELNEVANGKEAVEREMVLMEARGRDMERVIAALRMENEALRREIGGRVEVADGGSSNVGKLKRTSSVWKRLSRA